VDDGAHRRRIDRRRRRDGDEGGRTMKVLATILALGVLAVSVPVAGPAATSTDSGPAQPTAVERLVRQEKARRNDPVLGITRATQVVPLAPAARIVVVSRDGFDWFDAFLGAGAVVAAVAALGATMLAVRARTPSQA
jgi:hypothetical protein